MNPIRIKRIYEPSSVEDGYRILVDRLWPRGISKERARIDEWAKMISPSTELRKEFNHERSMMEDFKKKYIMELDHNEHAVEFVNRMIEKLEHDHVTLLFAAKNEKINHAIILKEWLDQQVNEK